MGKTSSVLNNTASFSEPDEQVVCIYYFLASLAVTSR